MTTKASSTITQLPGLMIESSQMLEVCSQKAADAIYERLYNPHGMNTPSWAVQNIRSAFYYFVVSLETRNEALRNALKPFSQDDECGDGFLVGEDDDHTKTCRECKCILAARKALEISNGPMHKVADRCPGCGEVNEHLGECPTQERNA